MQKKIDYKGFIEKYFLIPDRVTQKLVPFKLNKAQDKYLKIINGVYTRDILKKERQVGITSLILAIFTVDFLLRPSFGFVLTFRHHAIPYLKKTVEIFLKSYIDSISKINKVGFNSVLQFYTDGIENKLNNSYIAFRSIDRDYKIPMGRSLHNVYFDEMAFYESELEDNQDSLVEEIILSTCQSVPNEHGNIFCVSTENPDRENLFQRLYDKETDFMTNFKSREFNA